MSKNTEVTTHGFTDQATDKDSLNASGFCSGIATFIESCDTPMTIAIQGGWGSGKTTALQLIQRELDKYNSSHADSQIAYSTFNTWQYSTLKADDSLPVYLLANMLHCISQAVGDESTERVQHAKNVCRSALSKVAGVTAEVALGSDTVADFLGNLIAPNEECSDSLPAERLKSNISKLINDFVSPSDTKGRPNKRHISRIIIFVDDLDRLRPETAFELLEAMKNFLDCEHCVFVLAVDRDVVYQGIESKYGDSIAPSKKRQFFDKIIQLPFNLPTEQYDVSSYFKTLLNQRLAQSESERYAESYKNLFVNILGSKNPRTIKRVLNVWDLYQLIYPDYVQDKDDRLFLFATLLLKYRDEAKQLDDNEEGMYSQLSAQARIGTDALKDYLEKEMRDGDSTIDILVTTFKMRSDDGAYNMVLLDKFTEFLSSISAIYSSEDVPLPSEESDASSVLNKLRRHLKDEGFIELHASSNERYDFKRPESSLVPCSLRDKSDGVHVVFKFDVRKATRDQLEPLGDKSKRIGRGCYLHCKEGQQWATLVGITKDFDEGSIKAAEKYIDEFIIWAEA